MSIISTTNLGVSFAARKLFSGVNVAIHSGDRIGLIGQNGTGKTSLINALLGQLEPTFGAVNKSGTANIAVLSQELLGGLASQFDGTCSLYDAMIELFAVLRGQEEILRAMEERLATATEPELEEYGRLLATFERDGGYDYLNRTERTLSGLGFAHEDWSRPVSTFSGGEKTRMRLAQLLLSQADLLILDEPTNHLDVQAIEWLEGELRLYKKALLVVSHDRRFLDTVVTTIWELSEHGVEVYPGSYSIYLKLRDQRRAAYLKLFTESKQRLLQSTDFIAKNIARASTASQANGLLKRVFTDLLIIEKLGVEQLNSNKGLLEMEFERVRTPACSEVIRRVHALAPEKRRLSRPKFVLAPSTPVKRVLIQGENLVVGFKDHELFICEHFTVQRGERLAISGPNGSGKSTLLKILLGNQNVLEGTLNVDESVKVAYFSQTRNSVDPALRVIQTLTEKRGMNEQDARNLLAKWLFPAESAFKRVSQLSGGERTRLELSLLAADGMNLLILDEPTNHLDIESREALQEAVQSWDGTVLFVSHDRWFRDMVATRVLTIRDGVLC
ncbi:ribosomal protection-like ABC-F family protein [Chitinibacter sp. ZOR0017]|uniref:ribosomal protection-like ABC-F family protein n=1 Tax=Chitinibacter sp. ZOR0017 TaxID=1339254 RepID=UPI000648A530|nr:ABC-F family ATP-binding cassette domain-containing protein [Chitinibacter sp. ZOR0017]